MNSVLFQDFADEICALLCYYAAYDGNLLLTFRDNQAVTSSNAQEL